MNKSNNIPKNQHWVPQFYLRYFATQETMQTKIPKVWVWDKSKQSSLPAPISVRKICGQRYLYSPEDPSGLRNPDVENMFSQLEDEAARLWPYLIKGDVDLTDLSIREFIAKFISVLHLRNVDIYRKVDKIMELRDKLYGKPTQEFLKSRSESDPDPTHSGRFFLDSINRNIRKFTEIISQKRWVVLRTLDAEFFTSDRPVCFDPKITNNTKSDLYFPLSPNHVLITLGVEEQPKNYLSTCPSSLVSKINQLIEIQSLRFLISDKPRSEYLGREVK